MNTPNPDLTRLGLVLNAVFSLVCGSIAAAAPSTVGAWLGVDIDGWLRLFGVGLLAHAAALAWVLMQPRIEALVRLNLVVIAPYPLLMIAVVVAGLVDSGQALVLVDGAIVGAAALLQWAGLRSVDPAPASV